VLLQIATKTNYDDASITTSRTLPLS